MNLEKHKFPQGKEIFLFSWTPFTSSKVQGSEKNWRKAKYPGKKVNFLKKCAK